MPFRICVLPCTTRDNSLHVLLREPSSSLTLPSLICADLIPSDDGLFGDRILDTVASQLILQQIGKQPTHLEQACTLATDGYVDVTYSAVIPEAILPENLPGLICASPDALHSANCKQTDAVAFVVMRLRLMARISTLPATFLAAQFTMTDLHHMYEVLQARRITFANFLRKFDVLAPRTFLEPVEHAFRVSGGRPAQLYRIREGAEMALFERSI